jgi:hypothetical protein
VNHGEDYLMLSDEALIAQCSVDHYRASGPGGQKRNKTSSAVRLRHHPTGLSVTASDERYQSVNRVRALKRLREAIALHVRATDGSSPSELLRSVTTPAGGIRISSKNDDYHRVVQEVLDTLSACAMRVSDAAERLGTSTAHLVKFIESDPKVWERVNQMRAEEGLKALR